MRSLPLLAATLSLTAVATAQGCARERAKPVPADLTFHGLVDCGGVKFEGPGFQFQTGSQGCPLMAVYTPPHEVVEPATEDTETEPTGQQAVVQLLFFRCERDYLLFFQIGSACVLDQARAGAVLQRLRTVGCQGTP